MSEPTESQLKNRIQAGIMLVDHLLTAHGDAVAGFDASLADSLRRWVAGGLHVVPPLVHASDLLRCGRLRREPEGSWWWGSHFLGRDNDPETALELGDTASLVTIALGDAIDVAAGRFKAAGDDAGFRAMRRVLSRFHRWQSTGAW